jgi:hypothetical protein
MRGTTQGVWLYLLIADRGHGVPALQNLSNVQGVTAATRSWRRIFSVRCVKLEYRRLNGGIIDRRLVAIKIERENDRNWSLAVSRQVDQEGR